MDGVPKEADAFEELQNLLSDPITYELMDDAVVSPYGHTFSHAVIRTWLKENNKCPISQRSLRMDDLRPNYIVRDVVKFVKSRSEKLNDEVKEHGGGTFRDAEGAKAKYMRAAIAVQIMKSQREEQLDQLALLKKELEAAESILPTISQQKRNAQDLLNTKGEAELMNEQRELHNEMAKLEKEENQMAIEISKKKNNVNDLLAALKEVREGKLFSNLFGRKEKEIESDMNRINKELAELLHNSGIIAKWKCDVSEKLQETKGLLDEIRNRNSSPLATLARLQKEYAEAEKRREAARAKLMVSQERLKDLDISIAESVRERDSCKGHIDHYVTAMKRFLEETERVDEELNQSIKDAVIANKHKEKGNEHFKKEEYVLAAKCYTEAIVAFCEPVHLLNRAAAYTKLARYEDAESDLMRVVKWEGASQSSVGKAYRYMYMYLFFFVNE